MATSITKEINLVVNTEVKTKKGFSSAASKDIASDTEETTSSINKKIKKAINDEVLTHAFTESLLAIPRIIPALGSVFKVLVPVMIGALASAPLFGKLFRWVEDMFGKDEQQKIGSGIDTLEGQNAFIQDLTESQSNFAEKVVTGVDNQSTTQQNNFAENVQGDVIIDNTSTFSNTVQNQTTVDNSNSVNNSMTEPAMNTESPVAADITTDTETPTQTKLPKLEQEAISYAKLDISDFSAKVSELNSLDLAAPISKLNTAIADSVVIEKKNILSLFPVYENFANLLAKIVGQLVFIANPSTDTSGIKKTEQQFDVYEYGKNSEIYKELSKDIVNTQYYSSSGNGYNIYGSTVLNSTGPGSSASNNPQQTTRNSEA